MVARGESPARLSRRGSRASRSCWCGPREGAIFALEDRCAHRQVPLSKGTVDGCTLRCVYHGWRYDASGDCVDVPYLGKGKRPNGVRRYPCFERDGLIFVWPGTGPAAAPLAAASAQPLIPPTRPGGSASSSPATTPSCMRT